MEPYDPENDHYTVLGVPSSAAADRIKRMFRDKVQLVHPDGHRAPELATREMQRLNAAYAVLGDPARRRVYDEERGAYLRRSLVSGEPPAPARPRKRAAARKQPATRSRPRRAEAVELFAMPSFEQLFDAAFGASPFDSFFAGAAAPPRRRRR